MTNINWTIDIICDGECPRGYTAHLSVSIDDKTIDIDWIHRWQGRGNLGPIGVVPNRVIEWLATVDLDGMADEADGRDDILEDDLAVKLLDACTYDTRMVYTPVSAWLEGDMQSVRDDLASGMSLNELMDVCMAEAYGDGIVLDRDVLMTEIALLFHWAE